MSETLKAAALADWLSKSPSGAIPADLDAEVAETIIALRPEYAPPHSVTADAVLAALTEGPLVDPAVADALRTWLDAGPGAPPPATLPVGVVETTYALRPEMAPSLALGIDDILNEVSEGPLAPAPVVPLNAPRHAPVEKIVGDAISSSRRKWWTGTSVTVTAVAATALMFIAPIAEKATHAPSPYNDGRTAMATEPSTQTLSVELQTTKKQAAPEGVELGREDSLEAAREPVTPQPARAASAKPAMQKRRESAAVPAPPTKAPRSANPGNGQRLGGLAAEAEAEPQFNGFADSAAIDDSLSMAAPAPSARSAPPANPVTDNGPTQYRDTTVDFESLEADAGPMVQAHGATIGGGGSGLSAASIEDRGSRARTASAESSVDAVPRRRGDVRASRAETRAKQLLDSGNLETALETVQAGLNAPQVNPVLKARLLRLKADILAELGRETEAKQAREEAARVDPLR